jgi:hypothetical protein
MEHPQYIKIEISYDTVVPLLGVNTKEMLHSFVEP